VKPFLIFLAGCSVLAMIALGQAPAISTLPKSDWGNLRSLIAGAEIRVIAGGRQTVRGTFRSVSDDALIVDQASGEEMIARSSVRSVSLKKDSRRGRNMLIGLGAGGVTGLILGVKLDSCNPGGGFFSCFRPGGPNFGKEVLTPVFALVGLGIGAAIPTGGWREIYRTQ